MLAGEGAAEEQGGQPQVRGGQPLWSEGRRLPARARAWEGMVQKREGKEEEEAQLHMHATGCARVSAPSRTRGQERCCGIGWATARAMLGQRAIC